MLAKFENSKPIINYDEFFISCKELANSMAPGQKMDSIVAEIAIISLRGTELRPKKRIMPLRVATYFQNNSFIRSDVDKHFDNKSRRLSRCESISFPTLEILDKENPKESGHYWLMVLNIRDKRFEVLDSARTLKDKAFQATANKIMEGIKANWERHYNTSSVQIKDWKLHEIKCPKQDNTFDYSIYMLYNTDKCKWDGRFVLECSASSLVARFNRGQIFVCTIQVNFATHGRGNRFCRLVYHRLGTAS